MPKTGLATKPVFIVLASLLLTACSSEPPVSFSQEVKPILDQNCLSCHQQGGAGFEASGLAMTSYEALMKGSQGGQMILPGDVLGSNLVVLMEGRADPSISMPHGNMGTVAKADIEKIKLWISQGAKNN